MSDRLGGAASIHPIHTEKMKSHTVGVAGAARVRRVLLGTAVSSLAIVGGALAVEATPALAVAPPASPCATASTLVARASTEKQGPGVIGALSEEIQKA